MRHKASPSFGTLLFNASLLPLAALVSLSTYAVSVQLLVPESAAVSVDRADRQQQMSRLVDRSEFPGCVSPKQFVDGTIPRTLVVVDDESWSVDEVPYQQGYDDSVAGKAWVVLACK